MFIDKKPITSKYGQLKQDLANTKIIEVIESLYQEYNTQMLIKTSNYYNINPGLLINLGLLDYQQTSEYQQDRTNPHIINHILNYQSGIFNKNRIKPQHISLPRDLQFVLNIDIDWFMFRSRYNRI